MSQVIICEYCQAKNTSSNSHCLSCNAILRDVPTSNCETELGHFPEKVLELCLPYEESEWCFTSETAASKKLTRAKESFGIPADEQVLVLYDDTLFGSNKNGFAVCKEGLYWRNSWDTPTKRTSLTWPKFVEREIRLHDNGVDFGRGDRISVTISSRKEQKEIVAFFQALQALLQKD